MNLSGKNCLVTGASSGLELAVSKSLAEKGAHTILLCCDKMKGGNTFNGIKKNTISFKKCLKELSSPFWPLFGNYVSDSIQWSKYIEDKFYSEENDIYSKTTLRF